MNPHTYFRAALFAPLVLPLLALSSVWLLPFLGKSSLVAFFAYQLGYGGPGYVLFLPFVFLWARGKSGRQLMQWVWLLPLAFAPFCAVSFWFTSFVLGISVESVTPSAFFAFLPFAALYSVVFGYLYIAVAFLFYFLLSAIVGSGGSAAQQGIQADAAAPRRLI